MRSMATNRNPADETTEFIEVVATGEGDDAEIRVRFERADGSVVLLSSKDIYDANDLLDRITG